MAVEFRDYIALVEAPLNETRTIAVFNPVRKMYPNKPIKYVVNSHNHFDHLGESGPPSMRARHRHAFEQIMFYKNEVVSHEPWSLEPDRLALSAHRIRPGLSVRDRGFFVHAERRHAAAAGSLCQGSPHAEGMVMAYLPQEKILMVADIYTPPAAGAPMPAMPPAAALNLYENIKAYKIDVKTIAPLHGRQVPWAEFLRFVQKPN